VGLSNNKKHFKLTGTSLIYRTASGVHYVIRWMLNAAPAAAAAAVTTSITVILAPDVAQTSVEYCGSLSTLLSIK